MQVLKIHHPHVLTHMDFPPLAIALGFFDGVHQGHREVIGTAKRIAEEKQWKSAVLTFDPHPTVVLGKNNTAIQYITPLEDKIELIESLGIDYLFVIRFTSAFANLEPQQFVNDYLCNFNVRHVIAGFDYTYGKYGKGIMSDLSLYSQARFEVTTVEKLEKNEEKISSTAVRKLLTEGRMSEVEQLLGRFYTTKGTVVHGEKRGRTIGFPTANIRVSGEYLVPKLGVYAVRLFVSGKWLDGVCNVGFKPTFKDPAFSEVSIEVHIFDFSNSIYGEEVIVEWHRRIRDEQKFTGIESLKEQIFKDKQVVIDYFAAK